MGTANGQTVRRGSGAVGPRSPGAFQESEPEGEEDPEGGGCAQEPGGGVPAPGPGDEKRQGGGPRHLIQLESLHEQTVG